MNNLHYIHIKIQQRSFLGYLIDIVICSLRSLLNGLIKHPFPDNGIVKPDSNLFFLNA